MPRKRLTVLLAAVLVPATMAAFAGVASAAPDESNAAEGEKSGKKAAPGFTTEGSRRLTTSEFS